MIPKIIHYCWVGGNPIPESNRKCIASWQKYCPDYEIKEWNESNYDFTKNRYMREAYEAKQWGFVPDYARLDIIYEHGGIYLDVDVELLKPLDDLLDLDAFAGFESATHCAFGLGFGSIPKLPIIKDLRDEYNTLIFREESGDLNRKPSPYYQTAYLVKKGLKLDNTKQTVEGLTFFPTEYFCPKNFSTGDIKVTENTYSIHHFAESWHSEAEKKQILKNRKLKKFFIRFFGQNLGNKIFPFCKDKSLFRFIKKLLGVNK